MDGLIDALHVISYIVQLCYALHYATHTLSNVLKHCPAARLRGLIVQQYYFASRRLSTKL